jgi:hypothetical protein
MNNIIIINYTDAAREKRNTINMKIIRKYVNLLPAKCKLNKDMLIDYYNERQVNNMPSNFMISRMQS